MWYGTSKTEVRKRIHGAFARPDPELVEGEAGPKDFSVEKYFWQKANTWSFRKVLSVPSAKCERRTERRSKLIYENRVSLPKTLINLGWDGILFDRKAIMIVANLVIYLKPK